jgi:4,5-dihydroxyphthalate decarboxylase
MGTLQLSCALTVSDRSRPIINGSVKADGIDLTVTPGKSAGEIFWRQLHFKEFDVAEMSISEMLMLVSRGDQSWVMLPVFMTRRFFHAAILVRKDAGIEKPADLRGRKVAVPEYIQTACVWQRGVLADEFGVMPKDMQWYQERLPEMSHGTLFGLKDTGLYQHIPAAKTMGDMLLAGELDAAIWYHNAPNMVDRANVDLEKHPAMKRLFPKPRAEGVCYYQNTGIFPMNHAPVIRRSIVEKHPWVVLNLYNAFLAAKEQAAARVRHGADLYANLGWLDSEAQAAFSKDPLPFGVHANRKDLETLARYSYEQGLSPRVAKIEEVFAEATLHF